MGCFDVYCFICGNPCHPILIEDKNDIDNHLEYSLPNYRVKYPYILDSVKDLVKNTKWMGKCSMLQINDTVSHGYKEYNCNNFFRKKGKSIEHLEWVDMDILSDEYGIFIHTDCLKYVKKKYGVELKFSNLPKINMQTTHKKKLFDVKYGEITKYMGQDFDFLQIAIDMKTHLCSSPLKNDKNISQISKNIHALKIHKMNDKNRKSPNVSATFFKDGEIKLGKNKKFWIISKNKWVEIKEDVILLKLDININNKSVMNYIKDIPFFTRTNTIPIFIYSIKKPKTIEFILNSSYKDILMKKVI
jgi:hypothetical protein